MLKFKVLIVSALLLLNNNSNAQDIVSIADFGVKPNTRADISVAVKNALAFCASKAGSRLVFPKGTYHFYSDTVKNLCVGLYIKGSKNIVIDGNGSTFVFHGRMNVASVRESDNIRFENFSVDWERPYISQGQYVNYTHGYIDIKFDKSKYPYVIENNTMYFIGEGWKSKIDSAYCNLFDKDTKEILYRSHDGANGDMFKGKAEDLGNGIVRFYGTPNFYAVPGTYVVFYSGRYIKTGFEFLNTKNSFMTNITIYHTISHAVAGAKII